jgi:hypothetical protein
MAQAAMQNLALRSLVTLCSLCENARATLHAILIYADVEWP